MKIFFILASLLTSSFIIYAQQTQPIDYTKIKTLHVIGTAHFDTQWEWTIQTSINEYVKNTLKDNFKLFEKYPGYKFSFEGSIKYQFMKEYYPEDYIKLKDYIAQGRWNICGSSIDATDVNIPSPESVIRTILLGQNFYKKEFNKQSYDIFLPDCFGFGYALPSIMHHCGLKGFSTQKLTWGAPFGVPFDIGAWEGVDGSKVFASLNAEDYNTKWNSDISYNKHWIETVDKTGQKSGLYVGYAYYGVGDRGGAPTDSSVYWVDKSINSNGTLKVISAPADLLARELTTEQLSKLPQFNGELLTSPHGSGCYTSQCAMKRWNRKNELLADAAERASVMADWLGNAKYPKQKFEEAWTRFLYHQFHDDLTGTSIPEVYGFSWNDELISLNQFSSTLENATGSVVSIMDTRTKGTALVVYNPISFEREDVVEATIQLSSPSKYVKVYDKVGKELPSQIIEANGNTLKILILVRLAPVSFEVLDVVPSDKPCDLITGLKIENNKLENSRYKVTIDKNGDVSSILDKYNAKELLTSPIHLEMLNNKSIIWPAWEIMYNDIMAIPRSIVNGGSAKIIENGPVRITIQVTRFKEGSSFTQNISLSAGDASDKVDFNNEVSWNTMATLLKAAFTLNVSNPKATYDLGLGTIERGNNQPKIYEVPAQQWADITSTDNSYGVTILSDCKTGWDKPSDNTLRLTLIHTPATAAYHLDHATNDIGVHQFSFAVAGHKGDWRNGNSPLLGTRFNQPIIAFQSESHEGKLGKSFSMMTCNSPQVMIKALKVAENSDEIVVRVQELFGLEAKNVSISTPSNIVSIREINGAEEFISDLQPQNGKLVFNLKRYQPRTFAVKLEKSISQSKIKNNKTIDLNFDIDGVSSDNNRKDGNIDNAGNSFPAELFPAELIYEDVLFKMGSSADGQKNFMSSKGNKINIPQGEFNTIYILAASIKDIKTTIKIGDNLIEADIPAYIGNIGQWDTRMNLDQLKTSSQINGRTFFNTINVEPAFVKRTPLALVATHRHRGLINDNEAYIFCHLFKLAFDLPKGVTSITLPNNPDIRIAAITVSNDPSRATKPSQDLYDRLDRLPRLNIKSSNNTGMFTNSVEVTITTSEKNAVIFYTLDGTSPNEQSLKYEKPVIIKNTSNLNALAIQNGKQISAISSAEFYKIETINSIEVTTPKPGLLYQYFEDNNTEKWRAIPDFSKLQATKQGEISTIVLPDCKREDYYGVNYDGFIKIEKEGIYTFSINSDDGSRLIIDNIIAADNDGNHGVQEVSGSMALKSGYHKLNLKYFDGRMSNILEVYIEGPGISKQLIPAGMLSH